MCTAWQKQTRLSATSASNYGTFNWGLVFPVLYFFAERECVLTSKAVKKNQLFQIELVLSQVYRKD